VAGERRKFPPLSSPLERKIIDMLVGRDRVKVTGASDLLLRRKNVSIQIDIRERSAGIVPELFRFKSTYEKGAPPFAVGSWKN
jgi:hypothetical protein